MANVAGKWNPQTKKFEFPKPVEGKKRAAPVRGDIAMISIPNSIYDQCIAAAKADGANFKNKDGKDEYRDGRARRTVRLYVIQGVTDLLASRSKK